MHSIECVPATRLSEVWTHLLHEFDAESVLIQAILPCGELLSARVARDATATVASVLGVEDQCEKHVQESSIR